VIEASDTAKAGSKRDLSYRQIGLINELFCEMQAPSVRHRHG